MFWSEFYKMIYCVEDDAGIRDMMIYALNVAGFEAHGFENGKLFFDEIKKKAMSLKGSGYTFLVLKNNGEVDIINMSNQDTPLLLGYIPLFTIDLWEHAYYINYENRKADG